MTCKQQPPKSLHMRRSGDLALCKQLAGVRGDSYSGHDSPIYLSPETEVEAQYNKHNVGSFYLYSKEAQKSWFLGAASKRQYWFLAANLSRLLEKTLPFCAEPTYLSKKLDRALKFCGHLESLPKKLTTCIGLLMRLAD